MSEGAPLHIDIADAPSHGRAIRVRAADGVGIRAAVWTGGARGTILIFPGRTEYIEKYGEVVGHFSAMGFACVVIDWRGQGLSDRLADDPQIGHVGRFMDYQLDLQAVLAAPEIAALEGPRFLLAHSMGGCIGYRALLEGLDVRAVAMTAPMWGVQMSPIKRPLARILSTILPKISRGPNYVPGSGPDPYVLTDPYDGNVLTSDPGQFARMHRQLVAHPELVIGGASYAWLGAALSEMARLHAAKPVELPFLTFLGSDEDIVSSAAIKVMMHRLPRGELVQIDEARHEILIETKAIRDAVLPRIGAFFS